MRILIFYPWLDLGGAPKTSITLAKGLKERGHEVFFLSKAGGMYEELLEEADIPLISAPYHPVLPYMFHLNLGAYRVLKKTVEDYSIDIIHVFHPNSYFLSLLVAPPKDIPVIFTAVWYQDQISYPSYPGRVIFVAEEFLDHARPYIGKHAQSMTVIPNRIDLDKFSGNADWTDFAREKALPETGVKIAFMSRLSHTKEKSVHHAIDAVDILAKRGKKITLAVAGDGPLYSSFTDTATRINDGHPEDIIRFIGGIDRTPELISWADIVIGIGRSSFEGIAAGKPTCIVGENGFAGVVDESTAPELQYYNFAGRNVKTPQDPVLLANAIERIMDDSDTYARLAEFSRRYAIENYGYRAGAEKLEGIYTAALEDGPLSRIDKARAVITAFFTGYCRTLYWTIRGKVKKRLISQFDQRAE